MAKRLLVLFLSLCCCLNFYPQSLDGLKSNKRDSVLIEISKEAVREYGPGYYREYKEPEIMKSISKKEFAIASNKTSLNSS